MNTDDEKSRKFFVFMLLVTLSLTPSYDCHSIGPFTKNYKETLQDRDTNCILLSFGK